MDVSWWVAVGIGITLLAAAIAIIIAWRQNR